MTGSPASRSCSKYHEATRFRNAGAPGSRLAGTETGVSWTSTASRTNGAVPTAASHGSTQMSP